MIAFIILNCGTTNSLNSFECSVDSVELYTKLDFFKRIHFEQQEFLESMSDSGFFFEKRFFLVNNILNERDEEYD